MKHSLFILVAFALLTLLATHPLWQRLDDTLPGDIGDPVLNAAIIAWDAHWLVTDPAHLFDGGFYYPLPGALAYTENLLGSALLVLPLLLLTGQPALAYNFVFLSSFVLAGLGMYLLMLHITRHRPAAFIAGVAFAFAPYHLASLAHIQLLTILWLPLLALALMKSLTLSTQHSALGTQHSPLSTPYALLLLFLWLQIASTLHGALFALLIVVVIALVNWRRLAGLANVSFALAALVFAILLIPLLLPYLAALDQLHAARPPALASALSAQPPDFLAASGANRLFGAATEPFRTRAGFTEEQTLFMGIAAPLLALAGIALGMGGRWTVDDRGFGNWAWCFILLLAGSLLLATGGWLAELLPITGIMRVPARWTGVTVFAMAGLCGMATAKIFTTEPHFSSTLKRGRTQRKTKPIADFVSVYESQKAHGRAPLREDVVNALEIHYSPHSVNSQRNKSHDLWQDFSFVPSCLRGFVLKLFSVFSVAPRWVLVSAIGIALFAESFSAPIPLAAIGTPQTQHAVYHFLSQLPGREAVIELPLYVAPDAEAPEAKRMYASIVHWRPLVNGYSGITPVRQAALGAQLKDFPGEQSLAALRALGRQGVRYVVVHVGEPGLPRRDWNDTGRARLLASGVVTFVKTFDDNELYELSAGQ